MKEKEPPSPGDAWDASKGRKSPRDDLRKSRFTDLVNRGDRFIPRCGTCENLLHDERPCTQFPTFLRQLVRAVHNNPVKSGRKSDALPHKRLMRKIALSTENASGGKDIRPGKSLTGSKEKTNLDPPQARYQIRSVIRAWVFPANSGKQRIATRVPDPPHPALSAPGYTREMWFGEIAL